MAKKNNKKIEKKESKAKDLYEGDRLYVWDDGDFVNLSFGLTSIAFPKDDNIWNETKRELKKFVKKI